MSNSLSPSASVSPSASASPAFEPTAVNVTATAQEDDIQITEPLDTNLTIID